MQRWIRHTASQASRLKIKAEWAHSNRKGLAPQKAAEADEGDATRDTYQRKVFYDGANFFVVYWTGAPTREVRYVASTNGVTWTNPVTLLTFSVAPYYGGNVDIAYPNRGVKYGGKPCNFTIHIIGSNGGASLFRGFSISGQTLTQNGSGDWIGSGGTQGGSVVCNLNGVHDYAIIHRTTGLSIRIDPVDCVDLDSSVPYGGTAVGGSQLLQYKSGSPFTMLALAKGNDAKIYYNLVDTNGYFANSFIEIATLGNGFSDFCATSEAQNIGDPERIHLVYVKSTGELCYRKFENDAWSNETVLVASGASYPVIAVGKAGRLYVFYVKEGKIWLLRYTGAQWLAPVRLFASHVYDNPAYLSTNQNVQNGKICLVWTEGSASPYKVMFAYLDDRWV